MDSNKVNLPDGFVLDQPSSPPPGFVLDGSVTKAAPQSIAQPLSFKEKALKAWQLAHVPAQMSKEGLDKMLDFIPSVEPTGNTFRDVALNAPNILAQSAKKLTGIPASFISPEAALMSGGLALAGKAAPFVKAGIQNLGGQLESASGIAQEGQAARGALNSAYNDVTQIFAQGKKGAQPLYEAAKSAAVPAEIYKGSNLFKNMYEPDKIFDKAVQFIEGGGKMEPSEALTAKQAVDSLFKEKGNIKEELINLRNTFDSIAKSSPEIAAADPAFIRGARADALRHILPQNKYGGASPFKVLVGKGIGGLVSAPLLSPAVQGTAATLAGLVGRYGVNPIVENPGLAGSSLSALVDTIKNLKK